MITERTVASSEMTPEIDEKTGVAEPRRSITILEPSDPRWHSGWFDMYKSFIERGVVVVEDFDVIDDPNDEDVETVIMRCRTTS